MWPDPTLENVLFTVIILVMPVLVFALAVLIDHIVHGSDHTDDEHE